MDRPPPETGGDLESYEAERLTAPRRTLRRVRQSIKEVLRFTNPFLAVGWRLNGRHDAPAWLASRDAALVPYMTGFRMSFRRTAIAEDGFDEILRKYGWFEDIDASYTAMRNGFVVAANRARIYHHRTAARRDDGYRMGMWAILNRGYVVMKHVRANPAVFPDPGREARRLDLYCRARTMAYRLLARDGYGQDRARGAADGLRQLQMLTRSPSADLATIYRRLETS
jgi:GT2 family glycosyltransferase